jgi:hypothetical protein
MLAREPASKEPVAKSSDVRIPAMKAASEVLRTREPESDTPRTPPTWRAEFSTPDAMPAFAGPTTDSEAFVIGGTVRAIPLPASSIGIATPMWLERAPTLSIER